MIEVKPYLIGMLHAIEKDYENEELDFEITEKGYRITFLSEVTSPIKNATEEQEAKYRKGDWMQRVNIDVEIESKTFRPWDLTEWEKYVKV